MIKQLVINGLKSYDDFGMLIATRKISQPKKKAIKETIPFSNKVYDFSNINGEVYWEERTLEYTFDIAEFTTEEMEETKTKVLDWIMNVHDADIYDPYIGDYHFHGSFDGDSWEEDFGGGTLGFAFTVYPYKISNFDNVISKASKNLFDDNYENYTRPSDYLICPINLEIGETYTLSAILPDTPMTDVAVGLVKDGTRYIEFEEYGMFFAIEGNGELANVLSITVDETFTNPKLIIYVENQEEIPNVLSFYQVQLERGKRTSYEPYTITKNITLYNDSSHRIAPIIICDGSFTIELNNTSYLIGDGTYEDALYLEKGLNTLKVSGYGSITFSYKGEKF